MNSPANEKWLVEVETIYQSLYIVGKTIRGVEIGCSRLS